MVKVKLNITNIQLDCDDITISFAESPKIGDEISVLNFLPYDTSERENFLYETEGKQLSFNGVITKRRWISDNPTTQPILLLDIEMLEE
ncbi:hypothetical protein SAMN05443633_1036 [Chryseobacterium arachidis]|uniref:Uncharacterized protein n=1 Tax=Chryseobacterium arachidis TaxID=1416778 RepID=A0A1M4YYT3_9FLAO|nr:hypothetical protein [Chryseobacterium arachidis]SHF10979.1 hypothetical protein SAMN05443633_1036 [Chryseobacterium arachidis]